MARYRMTMLFDPGPDPVPHAATLLDGVALPDAVTESSSSCAGSRLRVVLDFRSSHPATVCREAVDAVRLAWAARAGTPAPAPAVRLQPQRAPQPTLPDVAHPRSYAWLPDGGPDGRLVLVDRGSEPISGPIPLLGDDPDAPDDDSAGSPSGSGGDPATAGTDTRTGRAPGLGRFRLRRNTPRS